MTIAVQFHWLSMKWFNLRKLIKSAVEKKRWIHRSSSAEPFGCLQKKVGVKPGWQRQPTKREVISVRFVFFTRFDNSGTQRQWHLPLGTFCKLHGYNSLMHGCPPGHVYNWQQNLHFVEPRTSIWHSHSGGRDQRETVQTWSYGWNCKIVAWSSCNCTNTTHYFYFYLTSKMQDWESKRWCYITRNIRGLPQDDPAYESADMTWSWDVPLTNPLLRHLLRK